MCKISIITPVYGVENYLEKCIDSILKQTFRDFELIIVDDGSPDRCGEIADKYKEKDKRVKVIHKKNGGAPSARNIGIEEAQGEYFYFPDSDDWLEDNYLELLYKQAIETNAQLVISGYAMEYYENNKYHTYLVLPEEKQFLEQNKVRYNLHHYFDNMMIAVPWNKLYKASYIIDNQLRFPDLKWDDLHFNMEVIKNIEMVAISSAAGYHFFRSRKGSETTQVFDDMLYEKRKEQFEHILKVFKYWKIKNADILSIIYGYYASRLIQCIQEVAISSKSKKEQKELIAQILKDPLSKKAFKYGKINSGYLKILVIPAKINNVTLCFFIGKVIGFIKIHMPSLFYYLKAKSVNKAS